MTLEFKCCLSVDLTTLTAIQWAIWPLWLPCNEQFDHSDCHAMSYLTTLTAMQWAVWQLWLPCNEQLHSTNDSITISRPAWLVKWPPNRTEADQVSNREGVITLQSQNSLCGRIITGIFWWRTQRVQPVVCVTAEENYFSNNYWLKMFLPLLTKHCSFIA